MRTRIGTRLILGAGLVTLLVIGAMAVLIMRSHAGQLLFELTQSANQVSETIKSSTHYDMLENRRDDLHRQIRNIGDLKQDGIQKVRLFNQEGRIMFSSDTEEIGTVLDQRGEACFACHAEGRPLERLDIQSRSRIFRAADGTRILGIINPIPNEPSCWTAACHAHGPQQKVLGVLDVNLSMEHADRQIRTSRFILLGPGRAGRPGQQPDHLVAQQEAGGPPGGGAGGRDPAGGRAATWPPPSRCTATTSWATWPGPSTP